MMGTRSIQLRRDHFLQLCARTEEQFHKQAATRLRRSFPRKADRVIDNLGTILAEGRSFGIIAREDLLLYLHICTHLALTTLAGERSWVHLLKSSPGNANSRLHVLCQMLAEQHGDFPHRVLSARRLDHGPFPPTVIQPLPQGPEPSLHTSLTLTEPGLVYLDMPPGGGPQVKEIRAIGRPEGGVFHWNCQGAAVTWNARGDRIWLRARKRGKAKITALYRTDLGEAEAKLAVHTGASPRIRLSPLLWHLGTTALDRAPQTFVMQLENLGSGVLRIEEIKLPHGVAVVGSQPQGLRLSGGQSFSLKLAFRPIKAGLVRDEIHILSNASNPREACIRLTGKVVYPDPALTLSGDDGQALAFVRPSSGENASFRIQVTDWAAASSGAETVRVSGAFGSSPKVVPEGTTGLTLRKVSGDNGLYRSKSARLLPPGKEGRGFERQGAGSLLESKLVLTYVPAKQAGQRQAPALNLSLPLFCRHPDERRSLSLELIDVRVTPGGKAVAGARALAAWCDRITAFLEPLGIQPRIHCRQLDPPLGATGWGKVRHDGRDPGVTTSITLKTLGQTLHAPSPAQVAMLQTAGGNAGSLQIFIVGQLYKGLALGHAEWELFPPVHSLRGDLNPVCRRLNQIHEAHAMARLLQPDGLGFTGKQWTRSRRRSLQQLLQRAISGSAPDRSAHQRAVSYLKSLSGLLSDTAKTPRYLREVIAAAQGAAQPYYKPATLEPVLALAADKGFCAEPDRVPPDVPVRMVAQWLHGSAIEPRDLKREAIRATCLRAYGEEGG